MVAKVIDKKMKSYFVNAFIFLFAALIARISPRLVGLLDVTKPETPRAIKSSLNGNLTAPSKSVVFLRLRAFRGVVDFFFLGLCPSMQKSRARGGCPLSSSGQRIRNRGWSASSRR